MGKMSLLKELCKQGAITVNGMKARAGKGLKEGDRIFIDMWNKSVEVEALHLPTGSISRREGCELYKTVEEKEKSLEVEW